MVRKQIESDFDWWIRRHSERKDEFFVYGKQIFGIKTNDFVTLKMAAENLFGKLMSVKSSVKTETNSYLPKYKEKVFSASFRL